MINKNYYDIIIIGSGIAGLYSAYNIMKLSPKTSFLVLEKYKKKWIGGRWGNEDFYGTSIVTGAGIGRKEKDHLLLQLIKELNVKTSETKFTVNYAKSLKHPVDIMKIIQYLRSEYKKQERRPEKTFKQFAKLYLDDSTYNNFIETVGYSDYENEDVYEVLYNYGMEDNKGGFTKINIPWKQMVDKLVSKIGINNFKTSSNVVKINKFQEKPCIFQIYLESGLNYLCNKVIIATTIESIMKLVPGANKPSSPYKQIRGQTFLRLYGKFDKVSIPILKTFISGYTIVSGPLQKIIPIDSDKGIYMIAYSDNESATYLKKYLENNEKNRNFICRLIEKALEIPNGSLQLLAIKDYYWPIGTHYYLPLTKDFHNRKEFIDKVQHPENGMLVVGEVVSNDQGWSEGALESVEKVLTKKWVNDVCF